MVVQVVAADALAMCVRIVSPAQNARVRDIGWQEIAEPVHAVCGRPGLIAVPVQAMDSNNTANYQYRYL